jgi:hypothetical protein
VDPLPDEDVQMADGITMTEELKGSNFPFFLFI